MKSLIRDEATHAVSLEEFDEALDDVLDVEAARRPRTERGKILAEYISAILDAFERATTRRLVVSAFRQAGILYNTPDPHRPDRRVTYVDLSEARAVIASGAFRAVRRVARSARGQIRVENMNSNPQTTEALGGETDADEVPASLPSLTTEAAWSRMVTTLPLANTFQPATQSRPPATQSASHATPFGASTSTRPPASQSTSQSCPPTMHSCLPASFSWQSSTYLGQPLRPPTLFTESPPMASSLRSLPSTTPLPSPLCFGPTLTTLLFTAFLHFHEFSSFGSLVISS